MEALYDRIVNNEIKMKDEALLGGGGGAAAADGGAGAGQAGWLDTIMNLLPGRAKAASAEPNDEAIRRTHEQLRCAAARGAGWGGERQACWAACRPCPQVPADAAGTWVRGACWLWPSSINPTNPPCPCCPPAPSPSPQREGQGRDLLRGARQRGGAPHAGRGLGPAAGRLLGAV